MAHAILWHTHIMQNAPTRHTPASQYPHRLEVRPHLRESKDHKEGGGIAVVDVAAPRSRLSACNTMCMRVSADVQMARPHARCFRGAPCARVRQLLRNVHGKQCRWLTPPFVRAFTMPACIHHCPCLGPWLGTRESHAPQLSKVLPNVWDNVAHTKCKVGRHQRRNAAGRQACRWAFSPHVSISRCGHCSTQKAKCRYCAQKERELGAHPSMKALATASLRPMSSSIAAWLPSANRSTPA